MSGFKTALLVVSCLVVSFGGGAAATFALRKKGPEPAKPFELPKVLRAERFEVSDKDGKVRAWMGPGKDGASEIAVADGSGQARAALAVDAKGVSSVTLRDTKDQTRAYLRVDGDVAASSLCDPSGKDRILLSARSADASVALTDADGNRRVTVETAGGGSIVVSAGKDQPAATMAPKGVTAGAFEVVDGKGRSRARLAGDPAEGPASLVFDDVNGKTRTIVQEAGVDPEAGYALALRDETGRTRAGLQASADGAAELRLLDAEGKTRLRASADAEGKAAIGISDATVTIARLGAMDSGNPALQLYEPETGAVRAWLSVLGDLAALGFYDKDGKIRMRTGIDAGNDPYIQLVDL